MRNVLISLWGKRRINFSIFLPSNVGLKPSQYPPRFAVDDFQPLVKRFFKAHLIVHGLRPVEGQMHGHTLGWELRTRFVSSATSLPTPMCSARRSRESLTVMVPAQSGHHHGER